MVKVSVFMISYKHEKFIRQAIESVVTQKTNFPFELVISDDASPDGTRAICEEYKNKYPDIINLLPAIPNIGPLPNTLRVMEACNGEYIAFCEGDDFWVSPDKLQKQVDFLDANSDYSMCFSDVKVVEEPGVVRQPDLIFEKTTYIIDDFILSPVNIIPTPSLMVRNVFERPFPKFFGEALGGDMVIQLLIADKGKAYFMNEKLAAYRNHVEGMSKSENSVRTWRDRLMKSYKSANKYFNYRHKVPFGKRFVTNARWGLMDGMAGKKGMERFRNYRKYMSDYLEYSEKFDLKEFLYLTAIFISPGMLTKIKK